MLFEMKFIFPNFYVFELLSSFYYLIHAKWKSFSYFFFLSSHQISISNMTPKLYFFYFYILTLV